MPPMMMVAGHAVEQNATDWSTAVSAAFGEPFGKVCRIRDSPGDAVLEDERLDLRHQVGRWRMAERRTLA
jgi:hypothetical protein